MSVNLRTLLNQGLRKIKMFFKFIYSVFQNPFKRMSIWIVVILFFEANRSFALNLETKQMLVFAVGLVTVLTFLVTYLHANTADTEDKGQYYLGLNKKRWDLYKSFWFKRFTEVPIKLFLWTLIVLPVFKLITGHYIKAEYFFNTGITLDGLSN